MRASRPAKAQPQQQREQRQISYYNRLEQSTFVFILNAFFFYLALIDKTIFLLFNEAITNNINILQQK